MSSVLDEVHPQHWRATAAWALACGALFVGVRDGLRHAYPAFGRLPHDKRVQLAQATVNFCEHAVLGPLALYVLLTSGMKLVSGTSPTIDWICMSFIGFCVYDLIVRAAHWRLLWKNTYLAHHVQTIACFLPATLAQLLGFERAFTASLLIGDMLSSGRTVLKLAADAGAGDTRQAQSAMFNCETAFFVARVFLLCGMLWHFVTDAEASPLLESYLGASGWWLIVGTFSTFIGLCVLWLAQKLAGIQKRRREAARRGADAVSPPPRAPTSSHLLPLGVGLALGSCWLLSASLLMQWVL